VQEANTMMNKMRVSRKTKDTSKGQSLVEVALMLPLLVLILAGILDLGRAYMTLVALNDAAAEGATYASIHPNQTAQIVSRTADSSSALVQLDADLVTVDLQTPPVPGQPVTVTVQYEYQVLMPFFNAMVPDGTLMLSASEVRSIINQ
jgi:Flp pilus assembly protein TadG